MADGRTIAVIGATGAQGGGLARAILAHPDAGLGVRGITRNPDSPQAQALSGLGAEMVRADLDDRGSLTAAFSGCHGAYCVTNFWEHFSPERELAQARNLAEAARDAGLRHVVWSTLEDTRQRVPLNDDRMPTLMERYKVPHFDAKGEADAYFAGAGVPTTFLRTSFYWDNLVHFGMEPQRGEDGVLTFPLPMGDRKLPGLAVEDIGKCAFGIFRAGDAYRGRTVGIAGEQLTGAEMAAALSDALGEEVRHFPIPFHRYRSLGFPGAEDLGNMFQFKHDFNEEFTASRSIDFSRSLNPELLTFRAWLAGSVDRIPKH